MAWARGPLGLQILWKGLGVSVRLGMTSEKITYGTMLQAFLVNYKISTIFYQTGFSFSIKIKSLSPVPVAWDIKF